MPLKLLMLGMVALAARHRATEAEAEPPVVSGPATAFPLKSNPINPDWIISGNPQARSADHSQSSDHARTTAIWDCTAGEFRWYFGWDETVVIQEGEVFVTGEDGSERWLRTGDIAYFRGGTWATWRVDNYVRKIAFLRKPFPEPLAMLYRLRNALRAKSGVL